ncbi:hypothetical protein [Streptomyces sp. NPDC005799]|uniref:hypothetical protein n=1 Tax=Streptomyces sp. NPDC005799 TaxID=3154678 RepID=UPI0033C37ACE
MRAISDMGRGQSLPRQATLSELMDALMSPALLQREQHPPAWKAASVAGPEASTCGFLPAAGKLHVNCLVL